MENWKLLLAGIRNALTDLVTKTFDIRGSVEVSNLPEVQHVVIDNHQEPTENVVVSNLVDYKEELNKIIGELIKVPKDIKTADYTPIIKALQEVVRTLEVDKTDYSPIVLAIESAVKELRVEYPEVDFSGVINTIKGIQQFNLSSYLEEGELPVIINEKQIKKLVEAFGKKTGQVIAASSGGADTSKLVTDATLQSVIGTVNSAIPTKGINILAKHKEGDAHTLEDEGDGDSLSLTDFDELRTRDQRAIDLANCNVYTDYTAFSNDTTGLANSTNHVFGVGGLTFNKVDGAANTVYGGVSKSFTAINVAEIFEAGGFVGLGCYLSSLTNVVNVFLRIGTDASNYNCWTWPLAGLEAATWMNLRQAAARPDYARNTGTGWNTSAISYVAFGVEFSAEANTLAGIVFDHVHLVGGRVTASDITTSTTVSTGNVNLLKVANATVNTNNGVATAGSLNVTIASNSTGVVGLNTGTNEIGNVKNSGTFAVQATLAAETTKIIGAINGSVAHDAADANNPVKVGMKAIAHGTNPTAVAAADRTDLYANRAGIPFMIGGHPNIITKNFNVSDADGAQTDTDIIGAIGAGTKYVVTMLQVMCDQATTAATQCRIGFGTANTPAVDAAGVILSHGGIAPGSGVVIGNGGGIIGVGADGAELRVTCEDPAGGSMDITVTYYTIES